MTGARIHIYLLEKSRVAQQAKGERSYHVFYQLLAGLEEAERVAVHLEPPIDEFSLLNQSGCVAIDGVDDAAEMNRTRTAMAAVGMREEKITGTLAAVLLLGQLSFSRDEEDEASIAPESAPTLGYVSSLLGVVVAEELSGALCTRRLITRDDEITVPLTLEQARDSRDALAKSVYGRLFGWLVARCNEKLVNDDASKTFVGILDIFGFESFAVNSFEQARYRLPNAPLLAARRCSDRRLFGARSSSCASTTPMSGCSNSSIGTSSSRSRWSMRERASSGGLSSLWITKRAST
jgi:myosin heavy subunit